MKIYFQIQFISISTKFINVIEIESIIYKRLFISTFIIIIFYIIKDVILKTQRV
jgi:hypothetical protein